MFVTNPPETNCMGTNKRALLCAVMFSSCFPGAPVISTAESLKENHCELDEPATCEHDILRSCVRSQWKLTKCDSDEVCEAARAECRPVLCGDGLKEREEACDEGARNSIAGDCMPTCQPSRCGDGVIQSDSIRREQCDDGNEAPGDGCSASCQSESK